MRSLLIPIALLPLVAMQAAGQDQRTAKGTIEIEINENGQRKVVRREFDPSSGQDINELLKEMDVLQDIDLKEGEKVEIQVRKSVKDGEDEDVDIRIHDRGNGRKHVTEIAERPLLGVFIKSYTSGNDQVNGKTQKGALIEKVVAGSAAEKAGLMAGDIITGINGSTINDDEELRKFIRNRKVGDEVTVVYLRNGKEEFAKTTLGAGDEGDMPQYRFYEFDGKSNGTGRMMPEEFEERMRDLGREIERQVRVNVAGRPMLGVTSNGKDNNAKGALVDDIVDGSAAAEMGIQKGDVITSINGQKVNGFSDLAGKVQAMKVDDEVTVTLLRDGKEQTIKGRLKQRGEEYGNFDWNWNWNDAPSAPEMDEDADRVIMETRVRIEIRDLTPEEQSLVATNAGVSPDQELSIDRIEFAPNPTDGTFTLEFDLPSTEKTRVLVLNATGAKVHEEILGRFDGHYRRSIDLSDQPNGIYFVVIAQGNSQFTRKIIRQ
jgi:C-terminal processing protease CtpA/Prc